MIGVPARTRLVWTIFRKDLRESGRDRFFVFLTILGLAAYITFFWVMPADADETITVGVRQTGMDAVFKQLTEAEGVGLEFVMFDSAADLQDALGLSDTSPNRELQIGLDFPAGFLQSVATGQPVTVRAYVDALVPGEIRRTMSSFVREIAFALAGHELPVTQLEQETLVLGEDRAGDQIAFRERLRPLLGFFVLLMESVALGTLVAAEVQSRTVKAVLITPAGVPDFLAAKGLLGTTVAFTEAALLMLLIGAFGQGAPIILVTLLLGAVLVTGVGLIAGASGRDFFGMMFYSLVFLIPLAIPAIATMFPGTASMWVQVLPTYGLVQAIVGATAYGEGWADVLPDLAMLLGWCVAIFAIGLFILKRKVESL